MLKLCDRHHLEPIKTAKDDLEKFVIVSSLLPRKITPEARNFNSRNKTPIISKYQQSVRTESFHKISPSKHKQKKKSLDLARTSNFVTICRPNVLHSYLSYSEILQYLDYIKMRYGDFVKIHTLGKTFERRSIKCIEINGRTANCVRSGSLQHVELNPLDDDCSKKNGRNIVFIEAGTHAREWISVTVALNCIHQLAERKSHHRDLIRNLKFYIVPVINPDGYEYARNVNPRWRKNRCPHNNTDYIGTDCNRNFDFHWDSNCSKARRNTYQGDKPFSEHETKSLAKILHSLGPNILFFLSLHSYAQSIMYPWGYSKLLPKNAQLMESVAKAGRNAIKAYSGRYYRVGSISQITKRNIAGSVVDYAYGAVKIPLTLVMELPSREYGFQPPVEKIYPLSLESWEGIKEMCKKAYSLKSHIIEEEMRTLENAKQFSLTKDLTMFGERDSWSKVLKPNNDAKKKETRNRNNIECMQKRISDGVITSVLDLS